MATAKELHVASLRVEVAVFEQIRRLIQTGHSPTAILDHCRYEIIEREGQIQDIESC